jgi:very-short-patch-repair endonuclease
VPTPTSLEHAFERHAQRRAAGVPTPTVLVGRAAAESWLDAHRACGVVRASAAEPARVVAAYLDASIVQKRIAARIEARVLAARKARARSATERTAHETALWTEVARDALLFAGDTDAALLLANDRGERAFGAAVSVLGREAPALLVDASTDVDAAVRAAIAIAESAPPAPVAIATDLQAWKSWTQTPGRDHAKALLRALVVENAALEDARSLGARARETRAPADDDAARSAAERALFEALDAAPASRGCFSLNQRIDVLFGNRALEIDLACGSLRLAVEVDGYFHFQDPEAYRRDRRKDVVLQQEGYFVVRVLAQDITDRLDETVASIHRVMEKRR